MDKYENLLNIYYCTLDDIKKEYLAFKKNKKFITTEFIKNLYYYGDLFYKIILYSKDKESHAIKDMTMALCYLVKSEKKIPLLGYIKDYMLMRYVYKKHKDFIEAFWEANKFILNVI